MLNVRSEQQHQTPDRQPRASCPSQRDGIGEAVRRGRPANQAGSQEPAGQPGARRFSSELAVGIPDGGGWPQDRRRTTSPGGPATTEHTAGCARESLEPPPGESVAGAPGRVRSRRGPERTGVSGGADGYRRVIRANAAEPSEAEVRAWNRIRGRAPKRRRVRRDQAVGGLAQSESREVERRKPGGYSGLRRVRRRPRAEIGGNPRQGPSWPPPQQRRLIPQGTACSRSAAGA